MSYRTDTVLVHLQGKVVGPWPVKDLGRLKGFTMQTLVSYPKSGRWAPASSVLNLNSNDPPLANPFQPFQGILDRTPPSSAAVFDWKAAANSQGWSDRWFRRLAIFNILLVIGAFGAWSYPPMRIPIQQDLRWLLQSPTTPEPTIFGRALLIKGMSSLRFELAKFVRELHKFGFPLPGHVDIDVLKPKV